MFVTTSLRKFLVSAVLAGATLTVGALPASAAIQHEAIVGCSTTTAGAITPPRDAVTRSGVAQWSYSVYYIGDYRNPWVVSDWTAAYANAGYSGTYRYVNGSWVSLAGRSIEFSLPPHYGKAYVWELRFEQIGGRWSSEWVFAGDCSPPPPAGTSSR